MISIGQASATDADVIGGFVFALIKEFAPDRMISSSPAEYSCIASRVLGMTDRVSAFIARDGSEPVGAIILNECATIYAGGVFGEISELYVLPSHRSTGVGAKLLAAAFEHGVEHGWSRLEVGTPPLPEWQRTADFYIRNGFVEVGLRLKFQL